VFNYNQVISTHEGIAKNVHAYKSRFPKFLLKGMFIAGPLNLSKNCGILDYPAKENFVILCKKLSTFLDKKDVQSSP
jgi:hypothetical protein